MTQVQVSVRFTGDDYRTLMSELENHLVSMRTFAELADEISKLGTGRRAFMERIDRLEGLMEKLKS